MLKKFLFIVYDVIKKLYPFILFFGALLFITKFINVQLSDKILEYLKVISWPSLVITIILLYKDEIGKLIGRISKLTTPFGGVDVCGMDESQKEKQEELIENNFSAEIPPEIIQQKETEIREEYTRQFGEELRKHQEESQTVINNLFNQLSTKDLYLDFERIYNSIFGTQISLMRYLLTKGTIGETRQWMDSYFQNVKSRFPSVFDNWTLDAYLAFLINKQLVDTAGGVYKLTDRGGAFLSYITNIGYSDNRGL